MDEHQERDVARGLRDGDPDAWRALYDAFARRVWRCVARLMPDCSDVADVVQETFLAAARSARSFDPERGPLWAWLWGIARLHVALHYRKLERLHRVREKYAADGTLARHLDGQVNGPPDALMAGELVELVRATLTGLPVDYEMLLTARYLDGESVEVIANRERTTDGAVRSKLARARQAFRDAFVRQSPEADCLSPSLEGKAGVGGKNQPPS